MSCAACSTRVQRGLQGLPGVKDAQVNFVTGDTQVVEEEPGGQDRLVEAIERAGYGVVEDTLAFEAATGDSAVPEALPGVRTVSITASGGVVVTYVRGATPRRALVEAMRSAGYAPVAASADPSAADSPQGSYPRELRRFVWAAALTLPVLVLSMVPGMGFPGHEVVLLALTTPVVGWCGREFFVGAWHALRLRTTNMSTLVALGVGTAYAYSTVATLWPAWLTHSGATPPVYFEAAAVIVTLVLLGRLMEAQAKRRTQDSLEALMDLQPRLAHVVTGDGTIDLPVEAIRVGDEVLIKPGEQISVDGEVIEGASSVDESMITGEPLWVDKALGSTATAGTINTHGALVVRVTHIGQDTTLQQIVRLTREAQARKAPVQHLADKVCGIFVPAVLFVAVITLGCWLIWGPEPIVPRAMLAFVSVLIIACPCALGLATPTAVVVATGVAAQRGTLFRGGGILQRLSEVEQVVMDKTGTLTEGNPVVRKVRTVDNWDERALLRVVAAAESRSEHPLAQAIVAEAARRDLDLPEVESFDSETGRGVTALVDGREVLVGSAPFLRQRGMPTAVLKGLLGDHSGVLVAVDKRPAGVLIIQDQMRASAPGAVAALSDLGIRTVMATGDSKVSATRVAREAGIAQVEAGLMPGDKAAIIRKLKSTGQSVAMVGDGINDTPALAEADVGVAMGAGTHVAMEAADVTLMRDDLNTFVDAIRLSRRTMRAIRQNLFFAFIYNVIGIPIAAGVLFPVVGIMLSPMIASGAMAFSSVSVVLNSLRLQRTL